MKRLLTSFTVLLLTGYWLVATPSPTVQTFIDTQPSLLLYAKGGYFPLGRAPVVDAILSSSFSFSAFAQQTASQIDASTDLYQMALECFTAVGIPSPSLHLEAQGGHNTFIGTV